MLVATASLVLRKERIWERIESGRLLILSTTVASSGLEGLWCLEVDSAILSNKAQSLEV